AGSPAAGVCTGRRGRVRRRRLASSPRFSTAGGRSVFERPAARRAHARRSIGVEIDERALEIRDDRACALDAFLRGLQLPAERCERPSEEGDLRATAPPGGAEGARGASRAGTPNRQEAPPLGSRRLRRREGRRAAPPPPASRAGCPRPWSGIQFLRGDTLTVEPVADRYASTQLGTRPQANSTRSGVQPRLVGKGGPTWPFTGKQTRSRAGSRQKKAPVLKTSSARMSTMIGDGLTKPLRFLI